MRDEPDLWKGALAGIAGGALASLLMEQFQALWSKTAAAMSDREEESKGKPATVKAADAISQRVAGHAVPKAKQELAGEAVHYSMGIASGAIYGTISELVPIATAGNGAVFGTAVFLLADELSVPALGLSQPPAETPVPTHIYGLASHLVYGWVTELVRNAVRRALS